MKYDELVKLAYACAALHQKDALEFVSADDLTKAKQYRQFGDAITTMQAELEQCRNDAERLDWVSKKLFLPKWNGVVGQSSCTDWMISGDYRHTTAKMKGETFRAAIDKAMEARNVPE